MDTTPVTLLELLRQPTETAAWSRFVRLYSPLLLFWARRAGLQDSDAADLVQDVFVVLVQKLPEFHYDQHRSFRAWLHTITLNKWRDRRRQRTAQPHAAAGVFLADLPGPEPADLDEAEYRRQLFARALEILQTEFQPASWQAFSEHGLMGRPAADVAQELGLSVGAVYAAKFRILARLRQDLHGFMD